MGSKSGRWFPGWGPGSDLVMQAPGLGDALVVIGVKKEWSVNLDDLASIGPKDHGSESS